MLELLSAEPSDHDELPIRTQIGGTARRSSLPAPVLSVDRDSNYCTLSCIMYMLGPQCSVLTHPRQWSTNLTVNNVFFSGSRNARNLAKGREGGVPL